MPPESLGEPSDVVAVFCGGTLKHSPSLCRTLGAVLHPRASRTDWRAGIMCRWCRRGISWTERCLLAVGNCGTRAGVSLGGRHGHDSFWNSIQLSLRNEYFSDYFNEPSVFARNMVSYKRQTIMTFSSCLNR